MSRLVVGRLLAAILLLSCAEEAAPPQHLFLITCDTLRADHLGSYGSDGGLTPNLDALARQSVRFTTAYAPAPYTLPSIAGMMTSRHPDEVGIRTNLSRLDARAITLASELSRQGWRTAAVVSNFILRRTSGLSHGFEEYDDRLPQKEAARGLVERTAGATTNAALEMLDRFLTEDPQHLFLWVHYQDPHGPYTPPEELRAQYLPAEERRPDGRRKLRVGRTKRGLGQIPHYQYLAPHRDVAFYRAGYAGEVRYMDRELGRLLSALAERHLDERSAVVFAADHGEGLGEDDYWFAHGEYLNQPAVRVPLMIRAPGLAPEARDQVASLLDVAPTVAALFDVAFEGKPRGIDLLGPAPDDRVVYLMTQAPAATLTRVGIVGDAYKLLRTLRGRRRVDRVLRLPGEAPDDGRGAGERRAALTLQLDRVYREPAPRASSEEKRLSEEERDSLRSLGYLGD